MEDITINGQPGAIFKDNGDGDVDFYTFWYSVCHNIATLSNFRELFANIDQYDIMLRRFLESRGIAFNQKSTSEELLFLYRNWLEEIKKRGTKQIHRFYNTSKELGQTGYIKTGDPLININANKGIVLRGANLDIALKSDLYLDQHFLLFANLLIGNSNGSLFLANDNSDVLAVMIHNGVMTLTLKESGVNLFACSFSIAGDEGTFKNIKIASTAGEYRVYYNEELKGKYSAVPTEDYMFNNLVSGSFAGIAYLSCYTLDAPFFEKGWQAEWDFSRGAGFFVPCKSGNALHHAYINAIDNIPWGDLWLRTELISNTDYSGIDGEVVRLVNYDNDEFIHVLSKPSEIGMTVDMSSFISEEATMANMNKFDHLLEGMKFSDSVRPTLGIGKSVNYELTALDSAQYWGLNANILDSFSWRENLLFKPQGHIPFIPIRVATKRDNTEGYEISFFIESSDALDIKFGIYPLNRNMDYISRGYTIVKYADDTSSHLFLNEPNFNLAVGRKVWVRAVYSPNKSVLVSDKLNIGIGDNLYNRDTVVPITYILPYILLKSASGQAINFTISDVVVRPLGINTAKGIVDGFNNMFGIMKNRSGQPNDEILSKIEDELIPSNCNTNIKFL